MKPFQNITWLVALTTVLFGQIYFKPFYTDFRFSLGVVVFGIFLLLYEQRVLDIGLTVISILCFRVGLALFSGMPLTTAFASHLPSALYYVLFAALITYGKKKIALNNPFVVYMLLVLADSSSNGFELLLRADLNPITLDLKLQSITLTAIIRSSLILIGFFLIKFYPEMFHKEAEKRKMATWILHQSKLYNEIIFLGKSETDIEKAMKNSHSLYQMAKRLPAEDTPSSIPATEFSRQALSIARDIHEIKKDYKRIRQALTALLPKDLPLTRPSAKELIQFLCDDLEAYSLSLNKTIYIHHQLEEALPEDHLLDCLSLINNLAINAIDATMSEGVIWLSFSALQDNWRLVISDEGTGISEEELALIFDPGYSTKFDPKTGEMSTGIGLAQVEYIVKNKLNGTIQVQSSLGKGTCFTITFPITE